MLKATTLLLPGLLCNRCLVSMSGSGRELRRTASVGSALSGTYGSTPPARRQASVRAAPRAQRRPQPGVDPLQCPSCDYRARSKQGLSNHLREKHPVATSRWTCPHCGKVYKHKGYYTMHLEQCSAAPGPAVAPPPPVPERAAARSSPLGDFVCTYRGRGLLLLVLHSSVATSVSSVFVVLAGPVSNWPFFLHQNGLF